MEIDKSQRRRPIFPKRDEDSVNFSVFDSSGTFLLFPAIGYFGVGFSVVTAGLGTFRALRSSLSKQERRKHARNVTGQSLIVAAMFAGLGWAPVSAKPISTFICLPILWAWGFYHLPLTKKALAARSAELAASDRRLEKIGFWLFCIIGTAAIIAIIRWSKTFYAPQ
jgi:hypothetical protein